MDENIFVGLSNSLNKIALQLSQDQIICRLLKYTQEDPLSKSLPDWDVYRDKLLHKNIRIVPALSENEIAESFIVLVCPAGTANLNDEFANLTITIDIYTRVDQWLLDDWGLRPFLLMDRVKKLVDKKRLTNIGEIIFTDFSFDMVSEEIAKHSMTFLVTSFDLYNQ